ncbi:3-hydroxyisobutyrate dehydrogenase [Mycena amicta]|nr:3-hydroxyisobutyrate dehydrogenase [Mycena amicta]
MRVTRHCLQAAQRLAHRPNSTSFIGLGRMGSEMAYNLFSKTFANKPESRFVICDALVESASTFQKSFIAAFPGSHVEIVSSPDEAAVASQTLITMLPSSAQVKTVYQSILPAIRGLSLPTLCIDSTTLDVAVAQQVARDMVDAPVSGGVTGAKAGTLAFLVGGTDESFESVHPILSLMGQRIVHCGPSGAAMLLGQNLGLDPAILASVIGSSTGNCWSLSVNNPVPHALGSEKSPPCERDYEGGFATALMEKDMGLASDIASKVGSSLPLGTAALGMYSDMMKERPELARKDFSAVYRYIKESKL